MANFFHHLDLKLQIIYIDDPDYYQDEECEKSLTLQNVSRYDAGGYSCSAHLKNLGWTEESRWKFLKVHHKVCQNNVEKGSKVLY
jgi:hypothetical protein